LSDDLMLAGHRVWEALAVSEVLHLCKEHDIDAVIIGSDVQDSQAKAAAVGRICLILAPRATAPDVIWELGQLFPSGRHPVVH